MDNRGYMVFPAPAGINRNGWVTIMIHISVPRASGDKPITP